MLEETAILELIDIRRLVRRLLAADAALTAVARKVTLPVRELLHRNEALVAAFSTAVGARLGRKRAQLLRAKQGGVLRPCLHRKDCRAVCAHQPCDVRTDDMLAKQVLDGAQDSIVVERPALHDDVVAESMNIL